MVLPENITDEQVAAVKAGRMLEIEPLKYPKAPAEFEVAAV
jgi:hypothetical protein